MAEQSNPSSVDRHLASLAYQLRTDTAYMASVLFRFQTAERMDDQALAALLLITPQQLTKLALCKRPTSSQSFADQVRQLAAFSGAEAGRLAAVVRQVDALTVMQVTPTMKAGEVQPGTTSPRQVGWLAAARDRDVEADQTEGDEHDEPEGKE